jgi:phosphotransferase system enzyme I (PtsI)
VRGLPSVTRDGREITLLGNIEFPSEVQDAVEHGAGGIGLYRTEFLYHSIESPPDEEAHFRAYVEAMDHLGDRPITIRLLDLGADKFPDGRPESNPFLGLRSIRLLLANEALLRTQLRAIFRASPCGDPRIMIPLVSQLSEITRTREIIEQVKQELSEKGVDFRPDIPLGVMIEVPCAALMADLLARHCDFFSIGTNDLIQYTLAVDRNNASVAPLFSPADPSVLRLIKMTVEAAERHNIPVSVCGEMGGELLYTVLLVGLGVTTLSTGAKIIPELKKLVRSLTYAEARQIAEEACRSESSEQNIRLLEEELKSIFPEVL